MVINFPHDSDERDQIGVSVCDQAIIEGLELRILLGDDGWRIQSLSEK